MWAIIVLIAGSVVAADRYQLTDGLVFGVIAGKADTLRATFPLCGDGRRVTCIVDGDTLWLKGEKIRISDIDTPELSPPRCEADRVKGEAAKRRMRELLNAGPCSLVSGRRDEDKHGQMLRTVTRDGRSIGDMMIEEGLARRWDGARRSWCE
ncbi:thermonuclease family protein [Brucella intermedia]|uniref:thermonuclease family protein n=1 Tax=Brucella intermedia TaxID=94625 RepID=UPI003B63A594